MAESAVTVINLFSPEADCWICDAPHVLRHSVPRYEDDIVPDDYDGEWGGAAVCPRCFYLVRGMQEQFPSKLLNAHLAAADAGLLPGGAK